MSIQEEMEMQEALELVERQHEEHDDEFSLDEYRGKFGVRI